MAKWEIKKHKVESAKQELEVSHLVQDMEHYGATHPTSWIEEFHKRLKSVKKTNAFPAEYSYKGTPRNEKSLEIWKMAPNGDYKYLMFTVNLLSTEAYNPFKF